MRIPFQVTTKGMQNTDKAGSKGFGFVHVMEQTQKSGTNCRKEEIQQITVFQKEGAKLRINRKDTMPMLNLNDFESGRFKKYQIDGLICILRKDFEEWYPRQFRYKKITGEPPGTAFPPSYSGQEIADLLGIPLRNTLYELSSQKLFQSEIIDGQLRIDKESFDLWLASQTKYKETGGI